MPYSELLPYDELLPLAERLAAALSRLDDRAWTVRPRDYDKNDWEDKHPVLTNDAGETLAFRIGGWQRSRDRMYLDGTFEYERAKGRDEPNLSQFKHYDEKDPGEISVAIERGVGALAKSAVSRLIPAYRAYRNQLIARWEDTYQWKENKRRAAERIFAAAGKPAPDWSLHQNRDADATLHFGRDDGNKDWQQRRTFLDGSAKATDGRRVELKLTLSVGDAENLIRDLLTKPLDSFKGV